MDHEPNQSRSPFVEDDDEPTPAYETMRTRLGDDQLGVVELLWARETATVTKLKDDDDGVGISNNSIDYHLARLMGKDRDDDPLGWWPDGVGPLVEIVGMADNKWGNQTREVGLTEHGEQFAEQLVSIEGQTSAPSFEDMQMAMQSNTERINGLVSTADEIQDNLAEIENKHSENEGSATGLEDRIEKNEGDIISLKDDLADVEEDVEELKGANKRMLKFIGEIQEELGLTDAGSGGGN